MNLNMVNGIGRLSDEQIATAEEKAESLKGLLEATIADTEEIMKPASFRYPQFAADLFKDGSDAFQTLLEKVETAKQELKAQKAKFVEGISKLRGQVKVQTTTGEFSFEEKAQRARTQTNTVVQDAQLDLNAAQKRRDQAKTSFDDFSQKTFGRINFFPSRKVLLGSFYGLLGAILIVTGVLVMLETNANQPFFERIMRATPKVAFWCAFGVSAIMGIFLMFSGDMYAAARHSSNKEEAKKDKIFAFSMLGIAFIVAAVASYAREDARIAGMGMDEQWNWGKYGSGLFFNYLYYFGAYILAVVLSSYFSKGAKLGDIYQYLDYQKDAELSEKELIIAQKAYNAAINSQEMAVVDVRELFTQDSEGNLASKDNEVLLVEIDKVEVKIKESQAQIDQFDQFSKEFVREIGTAAETFKRDLLAKYANANPAPNPASFKFPFPTLLILLFVFFGLTSCSEQEKKLTSFYDVHVFDVSTKFDLTKEVDPNTILAENGVDPRGNVDKTYGYGEIKVYKIGTSSIPQESGKKYVLSSSANNPNHRLWVEETASKFAREFVKTFPENLTNTYEEEHSQLFGSIMTILSNIPKDADRITVDIYSDFLENSSISFYKADLAKLKNCDSTLVKQLELATSTKVPTLSKKITINLHVFHDAMVDPVTHLDKPQKLNIEASVMMYQKLFEGAGATVSVK